HVSHTLQLTRPRHLSLADCFLAQHCSRTPADRALPPACNDPGYRAAPPLDLPVCDPGILERLQAVIAEGHVGAAPRLASAAPLLLLPVFDFLGHQHRGSTPNTSLAAGEAPLRPKRKLRTVHVKDLALVDPGL